MLIACSRLQAAAVAFGESLPIPEIVAVGGQSDGKSSLLEAFLGVRTAENHHGHLPSHFAELTVYNSKCPTQ